MFIHYFQGVNFMTNFILNFPNLTKSASTNNFY